MVHMAEVCEGAPVAVSGWVLTDGHDLGPCAASSLHQETMSVRGREKVFGQTRKNEKVSKFTKPPAVMKVPPCV